ncbi:MAG: tetratricopeptide repeat protein [Candidatus Micrarchaeota archaeon]|nr:tetratricopeptide repeat protein [Candidatus Micrarchaeota archaeon]
MKHKAKLALAGLAATTVLLWSTEGQAQNKPSGQFKGQETAKETIISKEKAKSTATWKPNAVRSTVERIYIEEESMASAKKYADCYRGLVDSIVDILKNDLKIKPSQPDRFMKGISEVILGMGIDRITNSYGLMSTFIDLRGGACTNFSALVSDAAREMGMPAEYVIIRSQNGRQQHMVAKVGNYVYDILADAPCKFENLKKKYGDNVILVTSNPKIMVNIGYENKGYALLAKEDYSGAIKAFDKAIELWGNSPCSSLSHIGKGNAYYGNKDYANAIASYKQAFAKDSKCTDALINIGNVYSITGEHQNAIKRLETQGWRPGC